MIVEPSAGRAALAQRGRAELVVEVTGRSTHAAYPENGVNALEAAAAILRALGDREVARDPELGAAILVATEATTAPFPANSVVPGSCRLRLDRRTLPGRARNRSSLSSSPASPRPSAMAPAPRSPSRTPASRPTRDAGSRPRAGFRLARGAHQLRRRRPRGRPRRAPGGLRNQRQHQRGTRHPDRHLRAGRSQLAHQDEELIRLDELERGRRQFAALASIASR